MVGIMRAHRPESMRRHNERLVLTLLRRRGALPRSMLAQASGLSAQAAGNIVKGLIDRGLIAPEARVRGRVGQPTVPLRLAPRGAFFLGLKIGRRSVQMVLIDFAGAVLAMEQARYADAAPAPEAVVAFAREAAARLTGGEALTQAERARVEGIGIAMPFRLWDWQAGFAPWQNRDLRAEVEAATGLPAWLENDASCACAAELIFGRRDLPRDFLHVHIGHFAGGGLVLGGRLWLGPHGNAAALGSTPVPGGPVPGGPVPGGPVPGGPVPGGPVPGGPVPGGAVAVDSGAVQLLQRASLALLEVRGGGVLPPGDWHLSQSVRQSWLDEAGAAIAFAALSAVTILDLGAVVIDGDFPADLRADLVAEVGTALTRLPAAGVCLPQVVAGSFGGQARAIGAAALPLACEFMLDTLTPSPATGG